MCPVYGRGRQLNWCRQMQRPVVLLERAELLVLGRGSMRNGKTKDQYHPHCLISTPCWQAWDLHPELSAAEAY